MALCLASVSCVTRVPPPRTEPALAETPQALPALKPVSQAPAEAKAPAVEIRIAAVGDIMLGGTAEPEMQKYGYDYPFEQTQSFFKQAQIVFGNLEGPLTAGGATETPKKYVFRSPPDKVAPALARAASISYWPITTVSITARRVWKTRVPPWKRRGFT
jgi:poly-gamma-glutamate synthesis protein (capsule biosynthesis protein)